MARTEADWLRDLEKELPFPRNVEADGVQIHPVHRPARRPPYPGMAARPAFDALFFSAMAWCLTRGVSVVRRKDLPTSVERHLIDPGALDPGWRKRIRAS